MTSYSRRAFLLGRSSVSSPWVRFIERLQVDLPGQVQPIEQPDQEEPLPVTAGQARFVPQHSSNMHVAFLLAQHYDIHLGLWNPDYQYDEDDGQQVLWLDPSALRRCDKLGEQERYYIEPGCTVAELVAAGLNQFAALPQELRFIDWLSDPAYHHQQPLVASGVQMASLVLADCSVACLGPFSEDSTMSLNTPTLRRLVPELFQLLETEVAQHCLQSPQWPAQFRLDALAAKENINLAYLALGQRQHLGWVEWVILDADHCKPARHQPKGQQESQMQVWADELDGTVQRLFDPGGRFFIS